MLEPNKDLEEIFENAVQVASVNKHEYITLEHFLLSMLNNESFVGILTEFGTDVKVFKEEVENYINKEYQTITADNNVKPKKTVTVDRVLNRAFTHVLFSGRQIIEPVDCFISIFAEKKSHANYFIRKANIDKDTFINFVKKDVNLQFIIPDMSFK